MKIVWLWRTLRQTYWALALVLAFWAIAAKVFHAYITYPWLDIPTHFSGGLAIAYFFRVAIVNSEELIGRTPVIVQLLLSLSLTALAAVGWEFLEFLSDTYLGSHLNLGVRDTLSDLFFGLLGGSCIFAIGLYSALRNRTEIFESKCRLPSNQPSPNK